MKKEKDLVVYKKTLFCQFLTSQRLGCLIFGVFTIALNIVIDQEYHIYFFCKIGMVFLKGWVNKNFRFFRKGIMNNGNVCYKWKMRILHCFLPCQISLSSLIPLSLTQPECVFKCFMWKKENIPN
jgi:hypothetical protein